MAGKAPSTPKRKAGTMKKLAPKENQKLQFGCHDIFFKTDNIDGPGNWVPNNSLYFLLCINNTFIPGNI